jgi:glutamate-1-semialdehyde 2,1-aminomutase
VTGFNAQPELVPQFEVVLDEVQALPNSYQGAHSELGLAPDLLTVGNIIRGGFPVGALAGRSCSGSATTLEHAGTFNGA